MSVLDQVRAPPNASRSQLNGRWLGGLASSACSSVSFASTLALVPAYRAGVSLAKRRCRERFRVGTRRLRQRRWRFAP